MSFINFFRSLKRDSEEKTEFDENVDQAWSKGHYDLVLSYLSRDSNFPKNFDEKILLSKENTDAQKLLEFTIQRNSVHHFIKNGDLGKLQNLVSNNKSKFYFNDENRSAVFTAIKYKRFEIYGYLKSTGADFQDQTEWDLSYGRLEPLEKKEADHYVLTYLPNPGASVFYLVSRSKFCEPRGDFTRWAKRIYETLDRIEEISVILKVIQHADFLNIIFDFNNNNANHLFRKSFKERCNYKKGRLYIAAGKERTEEEILETVAREVTLLALELVYKNKCNPYYQNDGCRKLKFEKLNKNHNLCAVLPEIPTNYEQKEHDLQLLIKVPQIMAKNKCGKNWLQKHAPALVDFFTKKVLKDFQSFIDSRQNFILTNEKSGEIEKIEEFPLSFQDVDEIQEFLANETKNFFVIAGKNSWLCVLKALQGIYKTDRYLDYSDRYLVLRFQIFVEKMRSSETYFEDGSDVLVVEYSKEDNEISPEELCLLRTKISNFDRYNQNKKIIFAVHESAKGKMENILRQCNVGYDQFNDSNFEKKMCDLDACSRERILSKIFLQNKRLFDIIGNENLTAMPDFDAEAIHEIIKNKTVEIGSKGYGLSAGLDIAYSSLELKINDQNLIEELINKRHKIFIFEGFNDRENLESFLESFNFLKRDLKNALSILENKDRLKTVGEYCDEKFERLCTENPEKNVSWISKTDKDLILRKIYTPDFYISRKFKKYEKIVIKLPELSECEDVLILIDDREKFSGQKLDRIIRVENEEEAQKKFDEHKKLQIIYWLEIKDDKFVYKNSQGSLDNLRKRIDITNSKKCSISEEDFIKMLKHEKSVILADDPGEGKTTTLIKLIESQFFRENYWAVLVDLEDFLKKSKHADIADLHDYLVDQHAKSIKNVFKSLLKFVFSEEFAIPLFIFFDGFDEVSGESDRIKIISLLKMLKEKTKVKFLITTSLRYKDMLENSLSTFATRFEPLDDDAKAEFVKNYFQIRLETVLDKAVAEGDPYSFYANKFLEKMESIPKSTLTRFIGIPFQLYLMLEVSVKHFKEWVDELHNYFQDPEFSYVGKDMSEIFSKFIDKKSERSKTVQMLDIESPCDKFNKGSSKFLTPGLMKNILFKGITVAKPCSIRNGQNGDYKYIHPTFHEYYIAKLYTKIIKETERKKGNEREKMEDTIIKLFTEKLCAKIVEKDERKKLLRIMETNGKERKEKLNFIVNYIRGLSMEKIKENERKEEMKIIIDHIEELFIVLAKNEVKLDFIIKTVLRSQNYRNVRCFLNDMLFEVEKRREIPSENFEYFERVLSESNRDLITCAIQEGHAHIFNFFTLILKENIFSLTCRFDESLLTYACRCNRKDAVELVLKQSNKLSAVEFFKFLCKTGKSGETCLHFAAFYNNFDVVNLILEKATKRCSQEQVQEFLSIRDIYGNTLLHLSASCLGQYFSIITQELKGTSFGNLDLSPLLAVYEEYGYAFPEIPYDLLAKNLHRILLHVKFPVEDRFILTFFKEFVEDNIGQIKLNACNIFKLIIPKFDVCEIINALNSFGDNVLDYASANKDADLIKLISNKTSLFQLTEEARFCPMFAAMANDDLNTFKLLLESIPSENIFEAVTEIRSNGFNIFQLNVFRGKRSYAEAILNKLEKTSSSQLPDLLNFKTNDGSNALHLAAKKGHSSIIELLIEYAKIQEGFLYEYLISVNENNETALHIAARENHVQLEIAKLLLRLCETTLLKNDQMFNILHMAMSENHVFIVDELLKYPFEWQYEHINPNEEYTNTILANHKIVRSIIGKNSIENLNRIFGPDYHLIETVVRQSDIKGNIELIKCIFRLLSRAKESFKN